MKEKSIHYFTLIELLVVIAVISILASMLLPALSKAKEKARLVICGSNMKEIYVCQMMYVQQYDGYYPPNMLKTSESTAKVWNYIMWVAGFNEIGTKFSRRTGLTTCPTRRSYSDGGGHGFYADYVPNMTDGTIQYTYLPDSGGTKRIKVPSRLIGMGEGCDYYGYFTYVYNTPPGFPHDGIGNFLYWDGHIKVHNDTSGELGIGTAPWPGLNHYPWYDED